MPAELRHDDLQDKVNAARAEAGLPTEPQPLGESPFTDVDRMTHRTHDIGVSACDDAEFKVK